MRISVPSILIGLALLAPMAAHAQLISDFDGNGAIASGIIFKQPSFAGGTVGLDTSAGAPNSTTLSTDYAHSGTTSTKVEFRFKTGVANPWLRLTATGVNPTLDINSTLAMSILIVPHDPLSVGDNALGVTLGVRETNAPGPVGANGTGGGSIEDIGTTGPRVGGAPVGQTVAADGLWHDINFVMTGNGMALNSSYTGNGVLNSTTGFATMEGLYFNPIANTGQNYTVYIDDIRQVPNGNGGAIPEPGSMALLATGILPILGLRRRKK